MDPIIKKSLLSRFQTVLSNQAAAQYAFEFIFVYGYVCGQIQVKIPSIFLPQRNTSDAKCICIYQQRVFIHAKTPKTPAIHPLDWQHKPVNKKKHLPGSPLKY